MKMTYKIRARFPLVLSILWALWSVAGCVDSTPAVTPEDPKALAARMNKAKELRGYFDRSGGKYDALSPEDKQKVNELAGGEEAARKGFSQMQLPQGGASTVGGGPIAPP